MPRSQEDIAKNRLWVSFAPLDGMDEVSEIDVGFVLGGGERTAHGLTDIFLARVFDGSIAAGYLFAPRRDGAIRFHGFVFRLLHSEGLVAGDKLLQINNQVRLLKARLPALLSNQHLLSLR